MQDLQLTQDQEAAKAAFTAFAVSNDPAMVISGGAGVGKTTLLKYLMEYSDPKEIAKLIGCTLPKRWALTATTNKAAEVLSSATGMEATTIHSRLGLTLVNDYKTGQTKIQRAKNFEITTDTFIVLDEASMVDFELFTLIGECTHRCKVLYVGDHCQMAPIGEEISPVFQRYAPVVLNQVVRSQHTPAITKLCQQLRRTVETGVFEPIEEVPGVIDYLDPATAEMMIQEAFVDQNREDCRILSFTNGKVIGFNNYLRTHRHLPPELVAGDKVVSNSVTFTQDTPIGAPPKRLRIEQELVVYSTEEPEIYKRLSGLELEVYRVITSAGEVFMPVDRPHLEAVLKHYVKNKEWRSYYHLKENIADLRPRDACTVYKSQGSTYHTVFVDLSDIGTCRVPSQTARMLYVACSRPTHRICFIGDLPPKYRGG